MPDSRHLITVISGGFDPLHIGHLRLIQAAHKFDGKVTKLIVGLNSDEWLVRKKGAKFMHFAHRAELIEGYTEVDQVMAFDDSDDTACDLLRKIRNDYPKHAYRVVFCNGGDRTEGNIPEHKVATELDIEFAYNVGGGKIASSSELVGKYLAETNKDNQT